MRIRNVLRVLGSVAASLLLPAVAFAQASIAGVVRDTSGAVLPGVTVEATSPALIEKVRSAVTDGSGQYRIVDLRPGTYTVTFTLAGFNTVKREGVALTGTFTATVNADLQVGALEETITVTGAAPTVDVQSATRQRVIDSEMLAVIPASRQPHTFAALIPGVTITTGQDVGGSTGNGLFPRMAIHGSKTTDTRLTLNGVSVHTMVTGGEASPYAPNMAAYQEVAIDSASVSAEMAVGGLRMNLIPRDGGNVFGGVFFGSFTSGALQGNNYTQELRDKGLRAPDSIKTNWDLNPGFGGPVKRDKVWFYVAGRVNVAENYVAGMFYNTNANKPDVWTFEPDSSRQASNDSIWRDGTGRLTWQVNPNNKLAAMYNHQVHCFCLATVSATQAPEAARYWYFPMTRFVYGEWSSPLTNRLLLEAAISRRFERFIMDRPRDLNPAMIHVMEQSTGLHYRARDSYANNYTEHLYYRGAVSFITGSHAFKVGFNDAGGSVTRRPYDNQPVSYRFNTGVPNQITMRAMPYAAKGIIDHDLGLYAQDRWSLRRLTVTYGLRYDYYANHFPEQHLGSTPLTPGRDLTLPAVNSLGLHDVTPKLGAVYDLFGNGKTALKASLNKYLAGLGNSGIGAGPNPVNTLVLETSRAWTDGNRDYVPNCDLLNLEANGECGRVANLNFGKTVPGATYDPDVLTGWGNRLYNWEFTAGVQHELIPRLSADLSYFRRSFGNFAVTDNLGLDAADFDQFSIVVPADLRLPNGGGYTISGLYDLNPQKFGVPARDYVTLSSKYGKQAEYWHGVDVNVNTRLRTDGLMFGGGFSSGRTVTDNCEVVARVPEALQGAAVLTEANAAAWLSQGFCRQASPILTQVKALGSYRVPRIDLQVSATYQSLPGPLLNANFAVPSAIAAQSLGRPLSGNAANKTVNLVQPGVMYGERLNQLDLRVGKAVSVGRRRATLNLDVYNAFNADTVLTQNSTYGPAWLRPTSILVARFLKISAQVDF